MYFDEIRGVQVSFYERKATPAHILLKIAALRNNNGLKRASLEIGKASRTNFLLRISIDADMRGEIQRECLKSERGSFWQREKWSSPKISST
jgi:TnpA family transposase